MALHSGGGIPFEIGSRGGGGGGGSAEIRVAFQAMIDSQSLLLVHHNLEST